jgi:phosphoglycerate kinase
MATQKKTHLTLRSLSQLEFKKDWAGKTVLLRTDFNVPLTDSLEVADTSRIEAAIPTIRLLVENNCKVVVISHLGRPKNEEDTKYSMKPVQKTLNEILKKSGQTVDVSFYASTVGNDRNVHIENMKPGTVTVLENLRFNSGEKSNETSFAKSLAQGCDVFVNEAFSVCHRSDASVVGLPKLMPSFAGLALEKEVNTWQKLMEEPKRPFVMIIGGAKISDKVGAVQHLTKIADAVLVGGGTANNFLKAEGFEIYKSYLEESASGTYKKSSHSSKKSKKVANYVKVAEHLLEDTRAEKIIVDGYIPLPKIIMPSDVVAARSMHSAKTEIVELTSSDVISSRSDVMYLDIGPKTIHLFKEVIEEAGTIFWNGPLGVFENDAFAAGTKEIGKAIAASDAYSIIGGGDTLAAATKYNILDEFDYVSVAGGAALEFLSGKTLPGLEDLYKNV